MRNLVFGAFLLIGCPSQNEQPNQVFTPIDVKPPTPATPDVTVGAMKLWQDYEANEVSADMRYKNKWLLVSGEIDAIDKDFSGKPYLYLKSPSLIMRVPIRFQADENTLISTLQKGQSFTALCKCQGRKIGSPDLTDCLPR